ncbi:MAG: alpha/beta hydrolase [Luteimonas sp.]
MKPSPKRVLTAAVLALGTLLSTGCERVIFGLANRGTAPPSDSVVYADATGLALDVYRPQAAADGPAPVVVFFYGGSWQRGSRDQYRFVGSRLAEHGVLAVVADYRTFPRAGFPAFMDDAAQAVAWAKANAVRYGGDPARLFIAGHSAGAQIAGLLGTDGRSLPRAGAPLTGIAGVIGLSGPYDFAITGQYQPIFGPPSQYPDAQALNFVDGDEPPFLLVHGTTDRVVEARDSELLDAKLRAHGVATTLLLLPDTGHFAPLAGFYDAQRAPAVLPAVLEFIRTTPATAG